MSRPLPDLYPRSRIWSGRWNGSIVAARNDGPASSATEERVNSHPFLQSKVEGTFKPAVRVGIAHEKAAAFVSIRRSNSTGTDFQFLRPSYVVDSEGTQHNRNYQTHAINVDELLSKGGAWFPPDPHPEAGPSNPSLQRPWWTRWLRKAWNPNACKLFF